MRMYKRLIVICICAICLCLLVVCFTLVNNTTPTIAKALLFQKGTFYTDAQLSEIADFVDSTDELISLYPPSHIRTMKNIVNKGNKIDGFRIIYLGETQALELIIDSLGNRIWQFHYNMIESKKTFDSLSLGQTLADVQNLDPNGKYLFLHTGRSDLPMVSQHYTRDGFIINVTYDNNYIITRIYIEKM